MSILWYFLFPLLFLNFNFLRAKLPEQIGRYVIGLVYSFLVFYAGNEDRSLSFLLTNIKVIAIFQIVLLVLSMNGDDTKKKAAKVGFILFFLVVTIVSFVYSAMPYVYGGAKNLYSMANVKESDKQSPKIDTENIIIIPPETAYYEMQTVLGSLSNSSLYKIGQVSLTKTENGAYYVAPIDIEGGIKAFLNKELPGVVYVSAEKVEEAQIINMPYKYGESLVLNHNVFREFRSYEPNKILLDADVELDDSLIPYYVGTYGHYKYGRTGLQADGVILYNIKTGEIKDYPKDKVPSWVDQIYTSRMAEDYNDYFGKYQKGLINSIIGQSGVHVPTQWNSGVDLNGLEVESKEVTGVIGNNGDFYYFTDHTNTSSTSTTMTGYTLMNTRTGEMTYYKTTSSINGKGAMDSIEKLLGADKSNWTAAQPILYNIYGIDTWIVPVINKADGSFVKLGLVTAQSKYSIISDTKQDLLDSFSTAIAEGTVNANSDLKISNNAKLNTVEKQGKIVRINQSVDNGKSVFYLKIDSVPDKIFMVGKNVNADVVLAREGDEVDIKYIDLEGQKIISVTDFTLNLK
ncbi:hypothetical protein IAI10_21830 [Clostridium sp. 19966]|uniref:hypothetical protein n=1 Tax=Clostridium sp. 19966 TaxID=2768166 RepID=UPI0028DFBB4E|nr:hypothetical protein [Clostridium sp. 19966]MDT8719297.1 hypothetical protein [Clostridium sp. 19966]